MENANSPSDSSDKNHSSANILYETIFKIQEFIEEEEIENLTAVELGKLQSILKSSLENLDQYSNSLSKDKMDKARSLAILLITKIEMELAYRR